MTLTREISLDEKVLLAAYDLEEQGKTPFSAEDLVIAAWRRFPDAFGLEGYGNEYPDSNRVFTKIMGDKGLKGRGWLLKVGEKIYQLSDAGKLHASSLSEGRSTSPSRSVLNRKQKEFLQKLMQTKAVLKVRNNLHQEIIFLDACSFWDISARTVSSTLIARLMSVESLLEFVGETIRQKGNIAFVHGDLPVTSEDVTLLMRTHHYLFERFRRELDLIKARKDERR